MADDLWSRLREILKNVPPEAYDGALYRVRRRMRREAACFEIAMDLIAVYVEQGRYREAQALAADAWLTFQKEGLDRAGAAALLSLTKALQEETATGAVAIANHVARYQHNRHARLELPDNE